MISKDELLRTRITKITACETRMFSISSVSETAKITNFTAVLVTVILVRLPLTLSKCFSMCKDTRNILKHELLTPNIPEVMSV